MEEILVDENGYKQFFEELKRLEDLSRSNSALGSEVYKDAVGDGWHDNFAFEESMRESRAIAKRIDDLLSKKQYLKIVDDKDKKENLVNIGDKVSINIKYSDDDIETEVITLTGNYIPNTTNEINEIHNLKIPKEQVFLSAAFHDVAKFLDKKSMLEILDKYFHNIYQSLLEYPSIWHSFVGKIVAREKYGIIDDRISITLLYTFFNLFQIKLISFFC